MQRNWLRGLFFFSMVVQFVGCATITRGNKEVLVIESSPPGADVNLSTGLAGKTPASFKVHRRGGFVVTIEKDGYERVEVQVESQVAGGGAAGMAGNVILGGLIGAAVDAGSGAMLELKPNPIRVDLVPLAVAPIPPPDTQVISQPIFSEEEMVNPPPETETETETETPERSIASQEVSLSPSVSPTGDAPQEATIETYKRMFPFGSDAAIVEESLGKPDKVIEFRDGRILFFDGPKIKITILDEKVVIVVENLPT